MHNYSQNSIFLRLALLFFCFMNIIFFWLALLRKTVLPTPILHLLLHCGRQNLSNTLVGTLPSPPPPSYYTIPGSMPGLLFSSHFLKKTCYLEKKKEQDHLKIETSKKCTSAIPDSNFSRLRGSMLCMDINLSLATPRGKIRRSTERGCEIVALSEVCPDLMNKSWLVSGVTVHVNDHQSHCMYLHWKFLCSIHAYFEFLNLVLVLSPQRSPPAEY